MSRWTHIESHIESTTKTTTKIDDAVIEVLDGPLKFFPVVIGFFIAFLVIRYNLSKGMKKELTEVQKSVKNLYGEDCQWN